VLREGAPGRVTLVLLDGASLDVIAPATAEGRLPHFARLLDEGTMMHLATLRPTQPGPVWAAVATGMYPPGDGVRSAEKYRFGVDDQWITLLPDLCLAHAVVTLGIFQAVPLDATAFRARPLWRVLGDNGITVGVVGVPLTHPAPQVNGFLVSDRLHLFPNALLPYPEEQLVFPPDVLSGLPDYALQLPTAAREPGQGPFPRDVYYQRIASILNDRFQPQVRIVRYEGIDVAGHHYIRYARPQAFGDVSSEERQRLGQVLEQQYAVIDQEIGQLMGTLGGGDVLMVVSGFGMEPQSLGKRLLAQLLRDPNLPGTHERAPDGFLLAWGRVVARGRLPVGAIVDVAPTVLYYLGLPVARDMDGYAKTDIFVSSFTADRPVTYIPSYGP
jgi:predicted AlkP superfamily phosphohydrolase/phosphomutase